MPTLTVNVSDGAGEPVEGAEVQIFVLHSLDSDPWLQTETDEDGNAEFEVDKHNIISVYVNDNLEKEDFSVTDADERIEVRISEDPERDDVTILSDRDREKVLEILDADDEPDEGLRKAAAVHKRMIAE